MMRRLTLTATSFIFLVVSCAVAPVEMKPIRLDVVCIAQPQGPAIVINCADVETWKEWEQDRGRQSRN